MGRWQTVHRNRPEIIVLGEPHYREFSAADARGVFQHGLEHRPQLARRAGDDTKNLGHRRLLLPRLRQLALRLREAAFEIASGVLRHRVVQPLAVRRGRVKFYARSKGPQSPKTWQV